MTDDSPKQSIPQRILNPYGLKTRALVLYHVMVFCLAILTLDRIAAYRMQPRSGKQEILLVSSETCPHSRAVQTRLLSAGVPFRVIDSRKNPIDSALAVWRFQSLAVPIVVIGEDVIYGNRRAQIDASLDALAGDFSQSISAPRRSG